MKRLSASLPSMSALASGPATSKSMQPHGSTASGGLTTSKQSEARAWLVRHKPKEVDEKTIALLESSLGVEVKIRWEARFPQGGGYYPVPIKAGMMGLSKDNQAEVISKIENSMTPLDRDSAEKLIAQMDSVLPRQNKGSSGSELAADIYVNVLMQHPADVSMEVVRQFIMEPKDAKSWFPTPSEIEGECRKLSDPRRTMLYAAKSWREPTEAEKLEKELNDDYTAKNIEYQRLSNKVGPGPAVDTGPRGEWIAAAYAAECVAGAAREKWIAAVRALEEERKARKK